MRCPVLARRVPEVLQSPGETLDRWVPPKAAKRSQVTDRGTPTTSPITVAAVFLPLEHRSAFPACAVQRALPASSCYGKWFGLVLCDRFGAGTGACLSVLPVPDSCRVQPGSGSCGRPGREPGV